MNATRGKPTLKLNGGTGMLRHMLSEDEKKVFLALAYKVALADHWVPNPEGEFLERLMQDMNILTVRAEDVIGKPDLGAIVSRRSRAIIVMDLICLAYSDAEYHANESVVLREVSASLGFSESEFLTMKQWAMLQADVMQQASEFINAAQG
jgi:uncharacterized tellurite resistance protein B-like protein